MITSFKFRVHDVNMVVAGMLAHPMDRAKEVMHFWRDYSPTTPEEFTSGLCLLTAPPAPFVPEEYVGSPIMATAGVYCGDPKEGEKVIQPLRECCKVAPAFDAFQPMPGVFAQSFLDGSFSWGKRNYWKSSIMRIVPDEAFDVMLDYFKTVPSPLSFVLVEHNGDGAINRVNSSETAFGHRDWTHNLVVWSIWEDEADDEKNIQWARDLWEAMQPYSREAVYVNYLDNEGDERVKAAYAKETYERLVELKNKYDPTNFFCGNQNIKPSTV